MLVEKGSGPERTDRLDPANGRAGCIEGKERNVSVVYNGIDDVKARYGHDWRVRRVNGVAPV